MKEGKCKCGNEYFYIGLDLGLCTKCIDKMEIEHGKKSISKKDALSREYIVRGYKYKNRTEAKINVPSILGGMKVKLIEVVKNS